MEKGLRRTGGLFAVRPAWAHSYGCKSRYELVTVSEVKRNCMPNAVLEPTSADRLRIARLCES